MSGKNLSSPIFETDIFKPTASAQSEETKAIALAEAESPGSEGSISPFSVDAIPVYNADNDGSLLADEAAELGSGYERDWTVLEDEQDRFLPL